MAHISMEQNKHNNRCVIVLWFQKTVIFILFHQLSSIVGVIDIPKEYFQKKIEQRKDQYVWTVKCDVFVHVHVPGKLPSCIWVLLDNTMERMRYSTMSRLKPGKTFPLSHKNIPCESLHFRCSNIIESDRTIHKTSSKLTPVNLRSSLDMSCIKIIIKNMPMFPMAIANKKTQTKRKRILNNYNRSWWERKNKKCIYIHFWKCSMFPEFVTFN